MASFGENLRRERELRGISLREVADATKIGLRFLQAIEQDRLDVLPGGMFPRAFVRQYAAYLGLEPDRLAADFAYYHSDQTAVPQPTQSAWPSFKRRVMLGLAGGAIVCALLLLLWAQRSCSGERSTAAKMIPAPPVSPAPMVLVVPTPSVAAKELTVNLDALNNCWVEAVVDGRPSGREARGEGDARGAQSGGPLAWQRGWPGAQSERWTEPDSGAQRRGAARHLDQQGDAADLAEGGGTPPGAEERMNHE
jgi:cytoskeleton protein RodZ